MEIAEARTEAQVRACFPMMAQLRPHFGPDEFVAQVLRQQQGGYRLAALADDGGRIVAVAGFRLSENLAWGRHLYVDDLVTDEASRSHGHGQQLLAWLVQTARQADCAELHLDSGVQRYGAHRFYLRSGMDITSHHFRIVLR
jgi:GNAT superfamily N-acetyltransferase